MKAISSRSHKETPHSPSDETIANLTMRMSRLEDAAFSEFFQRYYRRLWAYLRVVANGDETHLEDALQLTLEKVVKSIRVFDSDASFWAWLATIARHTWIDLVRKQQRLTRLRDALSWLWREPAMENNEALSQLQFDTALEGLSDEERSLLRQKYLEGQSYQDIAQRCRLSEKAVESRLARVRARLRSILERN